MKIQPCVKELFLAYLFKPKSKRKWQLGEQIHRVVSDDEGTNRRWQDFHSLGSFLVDHTIVHPFSCTLVLTCSLTICAASVHSSLTFLTLTMNLNSYFVELLTIQVM